MFRFFWDLADKTHVNNGSENVNYSFSCEKFALGEMKRTLFFFLHISGHQKARQLSNSKICFLNLFQGRKGSKLG